MRTLRPRRPRARHLSVEAELRSLFLSFVSISLLAVGLGDGRATHFQPLAGLLAGAVFLYDRFQTRAAARSGLAGRQRERAHLVDGLIVGLLGLVTGGVTSPLLFLVAPALVAGQLFLGTRGVLLVVLPPALLAPLPGLLGLPPLLLVNPSTEWDLTSHLIVAGSLALAAVFSTAITAPAAETAPSPAAPTTAPSARPEPGRGARVLRRSEVVAELQAMLRIARATRLPLAILAFAPAGSKSHGPWLDALGPTLRPRDVLGQAGDNVVALLLPGVGRPRATVLVEQLPPGLVVGLASYPEDGSSAEELLASAERALHSRPLPSGEPPAGDEPPAFRGRRRPGRWRPGRPHGPTPRPLSAALARAAARQAASPAEASAAPSTSPAEASTAPSTEPEPRGDQAAVAPAADAPAAEPPSADPDPDDLTLETTEPGELASASP